MCGIDGHRQRLLHNQPFPLYGRQRRGEAAMASPNSRMAVGTIVAPKASSKVEVKLRQSQDIAKEVTKYIERRRARKP